MIYGEKVRRLKMDEENDIVNASSSQEQMAFIEWLSDDSPEFFMKAEKRFWEEREDE